MQYEVYAPPGITLMSSNNLPECGKFAAMNAQLSGYLIPIIDTRTGELAAIGLPDSVQVFRHNK